MLNREISYDRRVAALTNDLGLAAGLIFTWLIPHLDAEGRMHGDVDVIKGTVFPRLSGVTPDLLRTTLGAAHAAGLLVWYIAGGEKYLAFPGFAKNQPHLRKDKEAKSVIPAPTSEHPPDISSGPTPELVRSNDGPRTDEEKRREEKRREVTGPSAKELGPDARSAKTLSEPYASPTVLTMPLVDGTEHAVTQQDVVDWTPAYPAVPVLQALHRARSWLLANPTKRKTRRGIVRYLDSWLAREQNRGRGPTPSPGRSATLIDDIPGETHAPTR